MSKLIIIAGTKGGIGKTFVATLLCDVAARAGKKVVLFDGDDENRTLQRAYSEAMPNIELIDVALETDKVHENPLDVIVNEVVARESGNKQDTIYIADLKAGTSFRTIHWMEIFPFELFREKQIELLVLGVITSDLDSVITFAHWVRTYMEAARKKQLKLVVVKNDFLGGSFDFFEQKLMPVLTDIPGTGILTIGSLGLLTAKKLRSFHATLGKVVSSKEAVPDFQIMDDIRCTRYLERAEKTLLPLLVDLPAPERKSGGK